MTWKASLVLVALVVACGDSSNGSGGDAGNGGGGAGGEGGAAGAGGEGGAGGEVDPGFGERLHCDYIERERSFTTEYALIQTTPGEVLHTTKCDNYYFRDGVSMPEFAGDPGCYTHTVVAEGDTHLTMCRDLLFHDDGTVTDFGWSPIYLRRE